MHISETAQVRATVDDLLGVHFLHHFSGLDTEAGEPSMGCGSPTVISGFTEWVGQSILPISVGWDWRLDVTGNTVRLIRTNCPRTNVQVIKLDGQDFAWEQSLYILGKIVDTLPWANSVGACFPSLKL
jgi:hypothetical protein